MNTLLQFKFIKASIEELHNIAHKTIFNIHPKQTSHFNSLSQHSTKIENYAANYSKLVENQREINRMKGTK